MSNESNSSQNLTRSNAIPLNTTNTSLDRRSLALNQRGRVLWSDIVDQDRLQYINEDVFNIEECEPNEILEDQESVQDEQVPITHGDVSNKLKTEDDFFIQEVKSDCCQSIDCLNINVTQVLIDYYKQFEGKKPLDGCLINGLKIMTDLLLLLDESPLIPGSIRQVMNTVSHFRHDVFSYWVLRDILDQDVNFGTDVSFPTEAESDRTPDFIYIKDKKVHIYEFSVVSNIQVANFMKGTDKYNSKYKTEIMRLENKGFFCTFTPIILSIGVDLDTNKQIWQNYDLEITDKFLINIAYLLEYCQPKFNYLFSMQFDPFYDQPGSPNVSVNTCWNYQTKYANKTKFYEVWNKLQKMNIDSDNNYLLHFSRIFSIREIRHVNVESKNTVRGSLLKLLQQDQIMLFNHIKSYIQGKEKIVLSGKESFVDDLNFKYDHNPTLLSEKFFSNLFLNSSLKNDKYDLTEVNTSIKSLWSLPKSELVTENTINSIIDSLNIYKYDRKKMVA